MSLAWMCLLAHASLSPSFFIKQFSDRCDWSPQTLLYLVALPSHLPSATYFEPSIALYLSVNFAFLLVVML